MSRHEVRFARRARHRAHRARRGALLPAALLAAWGAATAGLSAQVTSPGDLSVAHEDWSGPGDCARCHDIGSRRTSDTRCLSCHTPLAGRIEAGAGFHAGRATDCASCHREHQGPAARPVSFEPAGFDHATIGYPLAGAHGDLECAGCHNTLTVRDREVRLFKGRYGALTRTYLGLSARCAACHEARDPHAGQFEGRVCASCHDEEAWSPAARFDHASARYPLTGRHRAVGCASCHRDRVAAAAGPTAPGTAPAAAARATGGGPSSANGRPVEASVRYRPMTFGQCSSCHRDAHAGEMGGGCAGCHSTGGWARIPRNRFEGDFDHAATGFALEGRHAQTACVSCHQARPAGDREISLTFVGRGLRSYPRPAFEACGSCHVDHHEGAFATSRLGSDCAACHTSEGWAPSDIDAFEHDRTAFALSGAHRVVPCLDCHGAEGLGAGRPAAEAPPVEAPTVEAPARERPIFRAHLGQLSCASCHADHDPHAGQFDGAGCESCHSTAAFPIAAYDHSATRFPLDGAHAEVSCAACHRAEPGAAGPPVVRYRPLDTACRSCHGEATEAGDDS